MKIVIIFLIFSIRIIEKVMTVEKPVFLVITNL